MPRPRQPLTEEEVFARWQRVFPNGSIEEMRENIEEGKRQAAASPWRKPSPGDPDVHIYQLTSQISLRIWGHGLEASRIYLFDLLDQDGYDIITPAGWTIETVGKGMIPQGRVRSVEYHLERGRNLEDLPYGERYVAPEGVEFRFTIPGERSVTVRIPRREGPDVVYHDM